MKNLSRRLVLSRILPASILGLVSASRVKAADQPHMDAALAALRKAKHELDQAVADKGGHREKAIALVNDAISEVEKGIKFARQH